MSSQRTSMPRTDDRPGHVTAAVAMSWVGAAATLAFGVLFLFLASDDGFLREYRSRIQSTSDPASLVTQVRVTGAVMIGWAVLITAVAALAAARRNWARIALTAMAAVYVVTAFVGPFASGAVGLPVHGVRHRLRGASLDATCARVVLGRRRSRDGRLPPAGTEAALRPDRAASARAARPEAWKAPRR